MNRTLVGALMDAATEAGHPTSDRLMLRVRLALLAPRKRRKLEEELTKTALTMGAILPQDVADGVCQRDWGGLLQWLIDNWETILKIILSIIALF